VRTSLPSARRSRATSRPAPTAVHRSVHEDEPGHRCARSAARTPSRQPVEPDGTHHSPGPWAGPIGRKRLITPDGSARTTQPAIVVRRATQSMSRVVREAPHNSAAPPPTTRPLRRSSGCSRSASR
jgi:hypothetical protein